MPMTCTKIEMLERAALRNDLPEFRVGDTVAVHYKIVEGDKDRIQVFQGVVLRMSAGSAANANFTVRRIASGGIGVERTFPLYSPRVEKVEVVHRAHVRRAKLYFLRERRGKAARLREVRVQ